MLEYAINDTHYLLPLAERLESQLKQCDRIDWLRQSCQRAIEQAAVERVRDEDEVWRIRGSAAAPALSAGAARKISRFSTLPVGLSFKINFPNWS